MSWLPSPEERDPVPVPPGVANEQRINWSPKPEKRNRSVQFRIEELPVISHNVSLFEAQLQFINNTEGKNVNKETTTIGMHAEELTKWKNKLEQHLQIKQNTNNETKNQINLGHVRLKNHLLSLLKRIENCINEYNQWETLTTIEQNNNVNIIKEEENQNRRSSWSKKSFTRRKKGNSFLLGRARSLSNEEKHLFEGIVERKNEREENYLNLENTNNQNKQLILVEGEEVKGECSICWEKMKVSQSNDDINREYILLCGHSFCFKCLNSLCVMSTYDPSLILDLSCPWQDCGHSLDISEVKHLVDDGTFKDYERNKFLAMKQKDPNTRFCPAPDCSALIETDVETFPLISCPICKLEYCFHCMRNWHGNEITCEENKLQRDEHDPSIAQFEEWIEVNGAKPCPNCKIIIEKIAGKKKIFLI